MIFCPVSVSGDVFQKVEMVVRNAVEGRLLSPRSRVSRVKLGRRLLFSRHCGERMVQVKVYLTDGKEEWRVPDEHICLRCFYSYPNLPFTH